MEYLLKRYKKLNQKERKGFTLVELLVVIAILAVLASVSVVGYLGFTTKAKNSNALTELTQAKEVIRAELIDNADHTYYYDGSTIVKESSKGDNYYAITFTYGADSSNSKKVLSYNCVKKGSADVTSSASWTTVLTGCFDGLSDIKGSFEVETSNGSITQIHYITKDKGGNATWKIEDDSLSSGGYTSDSTNEGNFVVYPTSTSNP